MFVQLRSACRRGHSGCDNGSCAKLLSEVTHLSWGKACQEGIKSVVDHLKVADVRRHFALCLEGYVIGGTRSQACF